MFNANTKTETWLSVRHASPKFAAMYEEDEEGHPKYRYVLYHGGRGSGKTEAIAQYAVWRAYKYPTRVLVVRLFNTSSQETIKYAIMQKIYQMGLESVFKETAYKVLVL